MQRIVFATVIVSIDDIIMQLGVMILTNLLVGIYIFSIDHIYLDSHLMMFEKFNQGFLLVMQSCLVLFTDFVKQRDL
jgi:hypothetical protein